MRALHWLGFAALLHGSSLACSGDDEGCTTDTDCKGDRICEQGECKNPQSGTGGGAGSSASGGTGGGTGATGGVPDGGSTGGVAGCPAQCQTSSGTCCLGPGVCNVVVPCVGNPCCD